MRPLVSTDAVRFPSRKIRQSLPGTRPEIAAKLIKLCRTMREAWMTVNN